MTLQMEVCVRQESGPFRNEHLTVFEVVESSGGGSDQPKLDTLAMTLCIFSFFFPCVLENTKLKNGNSVHVNHCPQHYSASK